MYKLIFYVPKESAEKVKDAVFSTGAGSLGNYSECSFEVEGYGQFRPNSSANPALGIKNELTKVRELKIEILCQKSVIRDAIKALKSAHPYEEVAFEVISIENHMFE